MHVQPLHAFSCVTSCEQSRHPVPGAVIVQRAVTQSVQSAVAWFQCREVHNAVNQCDFIRTTPSCAIDGAIDYNEFVFCDFSAPWAGMIVLVSTATPPPPWAGMIVLPGECGGAYTYV